MQPSNPYAQFGSNDLLYVSQIRNREQDIQLLFSDPTYHCRKMLSCMDISCCFKILLLIKPKMNKGDIR